MEMIDKKVAIQKQLSKIGKANGSAPPESNLNNFGVAYELFVSNELRSAAAKRYDAAKAAAFDAGIVDESEIVEGAEIATWKSKYFDVTMKQAAGSSTLDRTLLWNNLMKLGFDEKNAQDLIARSSKPRKGAVTIGYTLKG